MLLIIIVIMLLMKSRRKTVIHIPYIITSWRCEMQAGHFPKGISFLLLNKQSRTDILTYKKIYIKKKRREEKFMRGLWCPLCTRIMLFFCFKSQQTVSLWTQSHTFLVPHIKGKIPIWGFVSSFQQENMQMFKNKMITPNLIC